MDPKILEGPGHQLPVNDNDDNNDSNIDNDDNKKIIFHNQ